MILEWHDSFPDFFCLLKFAIGVIASFFSPSSREILTMLCPIFNFLIVGDFGTSYFQHFNRYLKDVEVLHIPWLCMNCLKTSGRCTVGFYM